MEKNSKKQRLSKVLAATGIASRRACEKLIFDKKITVNGEVITLPQTLVDPNKDVVRMQDVLIPTKEEKVYYILNKPRGYICSNISSTSKKLVINLFAPVQKRIFTIGRLDRDTTGLLLLTNDGHFAHKVMHPSTNLTKEYLVKTHQEITHQHLKILAGGMFIEKKWVQPVKVKKIRRGTIKIGVKEGKKRELRLIVQNAGLDLVSLMRIRIGGLNLGSLEEGQWRKLRETEKSLVFL